MMRPEIIVPVIMATALIWWIGRDISLTARLGVTIVTLVLIAAVVAFERSVR